MDTNMMENHRSFMTLGCVAVVALTTAVVSATTATQPSVIKERWFSIIFVSIWGLVFLYMTV